MAEGILKARWSLLGRNDLSVASMGVHGLNHQPAAELAQRICLQHGVDITKHVSRPLEFDELNGSDLVFTMEFAQKELIVLLLPQLREKTFLFGAWPAKESPKGNVKDPMGGNQKDYEEAYTAISRRIDTMLPLLQSLFR